MIKTDPCLLSAPKTGLRATMSVGKSCPMGCKHCSQMGLSKFDIDKDTSTKTIKDMSEPKSKVSKLYFDGAEPTTNKDLMDYISLINDLRLDSHDLTMFERVSVATNGIYMTEKKAIELKNAGLTNIMISLDGGNEKTHDFFRKAGSFESVMSATDILVMNDYDVRYGVTLWSGMIKEAEQIVNLAIDKGVKEVSFNWLQPVGSALKNPEILIDNCFYRSIGDKIYNLKEKYDGLMSINFHRYGELDQNKRCEGGSRIFFVGGDRVWPCSWINTIFDDEFGSVMSLKQNTLGEILLNDPNLKRFRRLIELQKEEEASCPALSKLYTGSFDGPDPISTKGIHSTEQRRLL